MKGLRTRWRAVTECRDDHVLETPRLRIRSADPDRGDDFLATIDDDVRRWQGYDDAVLDDFRGALEDLATDGQGRRPCPTWLFVFERATDTLIGQYVFEPSSRGSDSVWTAGWWIVRSAQGRGYGTESLAAVLDYGHGHLRLPEIVMGTSVENVRTIRQIERTGAVPYREGVHHLPNGSSIDSRWYRHRASHRPVPK
jgi:RimJ/RimL family protein N-acetyltransferase